MMDAEKNQQSPIMFRSSIETKVDSQYLCQFTMLLIDTVEELTGRVSQIEFVCRQHFPDLQTLSQSIQNRILGFNKSELEWRIKEESLLSKINELQSESQQSQAQIKQLNASLEEAKEKLTNKEQLLNRYILEKKELLEQVVQKVNESVKAKGIEEDLRQQIELKDKKIEVELSRRKSLFEEYNRLKTSYKHLKSQYNFLTSKFGYEIPNFPNTDTDMMEDEKKSTTDFKKKRCNEDMKNNIQETAMNAFQPSKSKIDIPPTKGCAADFVTGPKMATDASKSTKQGLTLLKPPLNAKKEPMGCRKGSVSRWRDTRTREEIKVGDPHNDFLDTPMENAPNLKAETRKVKEDISPTNECMDANCFDEETLDIKPEIVSIKNPISVAGPSKKPFKYVEPVRKKADRENLKGVECQQCKQFYDAVLPDRGKDAAAAVRCEHHDGVSRHRYRYAPPLTPEGFWNIGFDSDL